MYFSQRIIKDSPILSEMVGTPCLLNEHDTYLLNYIGDLSQERLEFFIKIISNDYLIRLLNLCDYLCINDLMSVCGKELATRMNNMNDESLLNLINKSTSNRSLKGIL